jgi:hypothetical protein
MTSSERLSPDPVLSMSSVRRRHGALPCPAWSCSSRACYITFLLHASVGTRSDPLVWFGLVWVGREKNAPEIGE